MKRQFELPVRKVMKASKSLWVYSKDEFLICKCFGHQRADYIVQAINSYEKHKDALDWIKGATDIEEDKCKCGRPTGVLAIHSHAKQALKEAETSE